MVRYCVIYIHFLWPLYHKVLGQKCAALEGCEENESCQGGFGGTSRSPAGGKTLAVLNPANSSLFISHMQGDCQKQSFTEHLARWS